MHKKFKRTVAIGLLCASMLLSQSSCSDNEIRNLENNLIEQVNKDANINFKNICYFASWEFSNVYHVAIVAYNSTNIFSSEEERFQKYYKLDYEVSKDDFDEIQNISGSFEAIFPFKKEVLEKLVAITENYDPVKTNIAFFTDTGEQIINQIT